MATKQRPLQWVHFQVNGVTGFVEIEPNGAMWCNFCGQRLAYGAMQGKLKSTVHSVMVQHSL
ncbi:TPA: hypothetical protein ACKFQO_004760, partial [Enterobacter hormaechei]